MIDDVVERLAALDELDILYSAPEPEFDDVVRMASSLCQTPTSLISLVTADRQWFKARIGFAPPQTPISQSVCVHALCEPEVLIVPDLSRDPRTCNNTLVTKAPHIRFYAGAVLRTDAGTSIGTVCAIDRVVRCGLSVEQLAGLKALARQTMALLCKRARLQHLIQPGHRRRSGIFSLNFVTKKVQWSEGMYSITGREEESTELTYDLLNDLVHPGDRMSSREIEFYLSRKESFHQEFRIVKPNGEVRWLSVHFKIIFDAKGGPEKIVGVATDVTETHAKHGSAIH